MEDDSVFNHIDGLDDKLAHEFHDWVFRLIVSRFKEGFLSEQRTRRAVLKVWQDVKNVEAGLPYQVSELLGEKEATKLFQDICDYYIKDPTGLEWVSDAYDARQSRQNMEDTWNQR